MKGRFFIILVFAIVVQIMGVLLIKTLFEGEILWPVEIYTLLWLAALSVVFYRLFKEQPREEVSQEPLIKESLKEGLANLKNITSSVEQLGTIYAEMVNAMEKFTGRLRNFPLEFSPSINGNLQRELSEIKQKLEDITPFLVHIKTDLLEATDIIERKPPVGFKVQKSELPEEQINLLGTIIKETGQTIKYLSEILQQRNNHLKEFLSLLSDIHYETRDMGTKIKDIIDAIKDGESLAQEQMDTFSFLKDTYHTLIQLSTTLQKVTKRAKLLSINAQVAASQQSQQQQSFTVVADEILSLSEEASDVNAQIVKLLHEISGKIEIGMETNRDILTQFKGSHENLERLSERTVKLNNDILNTKELAQKAAEGNGEKLSNSLFKIKDMTEEAERVLERLISVLKEGDQGLRDLQRIFEEQREELKDFIDKTRERIEKCIRQTTVVLETMDRMNEDLKDLQTIQSERCGRAEVFIEEALVTFEQLKTIDSLLRNLEREARSVQTIMEELLG